MALVGDLDGEVRVHSDGTQQRGVLVAVEAAEVGILQGGTALRRRWWRVGWHSCRQAGLQPIDGHLAYGLGVGRGS